MFGILLWNDAQYLQGLYLAGIYPTIFPNAANPSHKGWMLGLAGYHAIDSNYLMV